MRYATKDQLQARLEAWRREQRTNRHGYAVLAPLSIAAIEAMLR
jgi:hypothetical protein